jgi:hypothetical protein
MKIFLLSFLVSLNLFAFDHSHGGLDKILKEAVSFEGNQSFIDYKKIKTDQAPLKSYLASLSSVKKSKYENWNAGERLAFLINAYNAFTIKLIVDNYPVQSIKDLGGFLKSPWKKEFFTLFGKQTHLDGIEHDMIRKKFDEPRIHFAVVCASIGCPPIQKFAFKASEMEKQFKIATKTFLMDTKKNSYDKKKKKLRLSKVFKWYGDYFNKKYGSYLKFISTRITEDKGLQKKIANDKVNSSWNSYDWGLNEKQ